MVAVSFSNCGCMKDVVKAIWPSWSRKDLADAEAVEEAFKRHVAAEVPGILQSAVNKEGKTAVPHIADISFLCHQTQHGPFRVRVCKVLKVMVGWAQRSSKNTLGYRPYSKPVHFFLAELCDFLVAVSGFSGTVKEQLEAVCKRLAYLDMVERTIRSMDATFRNLGNKMDGDDDRQFFRGVLFWVMRDLEDIRDGISTMIQARGAEEIFHSVHTRLCRALVLGTSYLHSATSEVQNTKSVTVLALVNGGADLAGHAVLSRLLSDSLLRQVVVGAALVSVPRCAAAEDGTVATANVWSFVPGGGKRVDRAIQALIALSRRTDDVRRALDCAKCGGDVFVYHLFTELNDVVSALRFETSSLQMALAKMHRRGRLRYKDNQQPGVWEFNFRQAPYLELTNAMNALHDDLNAVCVAAQSLTLEQRWKKLCGSVQNLREMASTFVRANREQSDDDDDEKAAPPDIFVSTTVAPVAELAAVAHSDAPTSRGGAAACARETRTALKALPAITVELKEEEPRSFDETAPSAFNALALFRSMAFCHVCSKFALSLAVCSVCDRGVCDAHGCSACGQCGLCSRLGGCMQCLDK